jgi:hypothetical protein
MVSVVRPEWGEGRDASNSDEVMMLYLKRSTKGFDAFLEQAAETAEWKSWTT